MDTAFLNEAWAPSHQASSSAARVRRALLGAFAAGLALDVSIGTWLGASGRQSLVSSLTLGLPLLLPAAWHVLTGGGFRRVPPALVAMAGFVAWCAVSTIWARQEDDSAMVATMTRVQLLAVVWMGHQLVRSERDLRSLLAGYVLGCAVVVALAWRNNLTGSAEIWDRFAADGYDPNDMAMYLALAIPMAAYLAGSGRRGERGRLAYLLYIPAALSGILLSGSRTGGIAAALAVAAALGWLALRSSVTAGLALVMLLAGAAAVLPRIPEASVNRILSVGEEAEGGTVGSRLGIWGAGLEVLPEHIVAGVGVGGFKDAVLSRTGERIVAHNTPLSIAVELGAVGLVLFFGAFALALWRARRGGAEAAILAWSVAVICALGIESLTWEHRKPLWFVLLVAVVAGDLRERRRGE